MLRKWYDNKVLRYDDKVKQYNDNTHPRGEILPEDQRVYRVQVLSTLLKAGVPTTKLEHFRDISKGGAF